MKIRNGFVSNSSSSSFVIDKDKITKIQLHAIKNHIEVAMEHYSDEFYTEPAERWDITETNDKIEGWTIMDNFDMYKFLQLIGIPLAAVEFDYNH